MTEQQLREYKYQVYLKTADLTEHQRWSLQEQRNRDLYQAYVKVTTPTKGEIAYMVCMYILMPLGLWTLAGM